MTRLLRFVRYADVADTLRLGWLPDVSLIGTPHGWYSAGFVEWITCECSARFQAPWMRGAG